MNSIQGELKLPNVNSSSGDYRLEMVELLKKKKLREARTLLCSKARPEEMEDLFRFFYDNLNLFSTTIQGQDEAIIIIRRAYVSHTSCADSEINLSACMTELMGINT
jgi:hypothetical protein